MQNKDCQKSLDLRPFCGGESKLYYTEFYEEFAVQCTWCKADRYGYPTEQEAINAWNTRVKE